ncbi:MAG: hypothetical protein WDO24_17795 [Pseudomonadota bacterium]
MDSAVTTGLVPVESMPRLIVRRCDAIPVALPLTKRSRCPA